MNWADLNYDEDTAKVALSYEDYRGWRAWALGRAYPKTWKSKRVKPIPGVLDVVDEEAG